MNQCTSDHSVDTVSNQDYNRVIWLGARTVEGLVTVREVASEGLLDQVYLAREEDVRQRARAAGIAVFESGAYAPAQEEGVQ